MSFRLAFVLLSLATAVHCAADVADVPALINSRLQNQFNSIADKAFKSDSFKSADLLGKSALATTTAYSTTGFVMLTLYEGSYGVTDNSCSTPTFVSAYPVNYCIATSSYSFKMQITGDDCYASIIQYFGDAACTNFLGTSTLQSYTDICAPSVAPYTTGLGHYAFQKVECTNSAKPITPTVSVTVESFNSATCGGQVDNYIAYSANQCVYVDGYTVKFYCDSSGAAMYQVYQGAADDCSITPAHTGPMDVGCESNVDDDDAADDDDYKPPFINPPPTISATTFPTSATPVTGSSIAYCPNQAPTLKPAFAPTMFPTSATLQAVKFSASQTINGITAELFYGANVNTATLMETIASTMPGVSALDITDLSVSDNSRRRLSFMSTQAVVSSVSASYTVQTTTTASASQLYYELSTAVASGAFNTALNSYATGAGALALVGCTSNSMDGDSGGSSNDLSMAALIGIIVGSVVGFCLIMSIIIAICCFCAKPKAPMANQQQQQQQSESEAPMPNKV